MFTTFPPPDLSHGCFGANDDSHHGWTPVQRHKNAPKRKQPHETRSESDSHQSMKRSTNVMNGFNVEVATPRNFMNYKMNVPKPSEARTVPHKYGKKRKMGKNKTSKPVENLDLLIAGFKANDELLLRGLDTLKNANEAWRHSIQNLKCLLSAKQRFHNRLVDREMENVPHQRRSHVRQLYLEAFEQA